MSARASSVGTDGLAQARGRLADRLRAGGVAGAAVSEAFGTVPRHAFVSRELAAEAYEDAAIVVKSDAGGLPVSASTQPAMMAIMLEQARLTAGQRVLEVGTGTGYNAALIAEIVGDRGSVVTIDVESDLADQARASLAAAGYPDVVVVHGDGADGVPGHAPYDRVIVTAGVWDLAPRWLAQLGPGGRIVAPISVRGIQLSVAFEHAATHWAGRSARRCGFIRMTGRSAGPEALVPLGPQPGLHALVADGPAAGAGPLHEALSGAGAEIAAPSRLRVSGIAELADLDLWLALTEPDLSRLNMMGRHEGRASQSQRRVAARLPLGGFARAGSAGRLAVASLAVPSQPAAGDCPRGVAFHGYGPGGAALAAHLAERAVVWDELGRPGAGNLGLAAWPPGTRPEAPEGTMIIRRPGTVLVAGWPAAAQTSSR
ncbi:MAG TPA: methyltransferase domain-containing protein [Streptosporangiaceae bacterium]|nr:methyltransferase domain-containing protein [Streptosporangiaceae bacterium]